MKPQSSGRDWERGNRARVPAPAVQEGAGHVACQGRAARWLIVLALLILGEVARAEGTGLSPGKSERLVWVAGSGLAEAHAPRLGEEHRSGDGSAILLTGRANTTNQRGQEQLAQARRALAQLRFQDAKQAASLAVSQDSNDALA